MGKKLVIFALLVLIIAGALFEYFYVKGATQRLTGSLERVQEKLEEENLSAAQVAAHDFHAAWENEKQRLEALFEHNEVDIISATAERIETYCDIQDRDDALAEVAACFFYINHLHEMIGVRWENIF